MARHLCFQKECLLAYGFLKYFGVYFIADFERCLKTESCAPWCLNVTL